MNKRSTYNVTESRKLKLERLAVNATTKLGKPIIWTEIIGFNNKLFVTCCYKVELFLY